ncbi:L-aspartate oxidase [hydrothermal vent metagenome]|uniref:L-aspartate oxidase n=1 Tax=hydrothermal vent metagenome TaxID=652676 RepID=A0A3B0Z0Z8_9ZZZZ
MNETAQSDILIIGSGAAGLSLALTLSKKLTVNIISKGPLTESSSLYAQGGIAAVLKDNDSFESHINDTITAGAGLCNPETVAYTVEHGPEAIQWLSQVGVDFTRLNQSNGDKSNLDELNPTTSNYHLTKEGGHSHRRVVHADDATGRAVEMTLEQQVRHHSNIKVHEKHLAIDLITSNKIGEKTTTARCYGAYVYDRNHKKVITFSARIVILATGGASKVYLYTSNPDSSTGDGIAMAWRAGCQVANMEFNQFHPTCLYHPDAKSYLITEAVRGEGGHLLLPDGSRFMERFDSRQELAPRDIVARAIDHEMKRLGSDSVFLDISHKPSDFIKQHFPTIYQKCLEFGYDMTREPIPVVPAAHYTCGGVVTNLDAKTDVDNLYAIGETACTFLHGANRMASNSLLECIVFAMSAAKHINHTIDSITPPPTLPPWDDSRVTDSDEEVVVSHNWDELRRFMWDYVGIVRSTKRLQRAKNRSQLLLREIDEYYGNFRVTNDLIELRNLATVADLIIDAALSRKESRGLHYTLDYPELLDSAASTILQPPENPIITASEFSHEPL